MKEKLNILQDSYIKYLAEEINKEGGKAEQTLESVIANLIHLVKKEENSPAFLPLPVKKLLAKAISMTSYIAYKVEQGQGFVVVEALFYWDSESNIPAGTGKVKMYLEQVAPDDFRTDAEREALLEATARGRAATRALSDAGIGLQYYGDISIPELGEPEPVVAPEAPEVTSQDERKKRGRPKKVTEEETVTPVEQAPVVTPSVEDVGIHSFADDGISLDDAKSRVADIGNCAGHTLGEIYLNQPRNLIWMLNNSSAETPAIKTIVSADAELAAHLR